LEEIPDIIAIERECAMTLLDTEIKALGCKTEEDIAELEELIYFELSSQEANHTTMEDNLDDLEMEINMELQDEEEDDENDGYDDESKYDWDEEMDEVPAQDTELLKKVWLSVGVSKASEDLDEDLRLTEDELEDVLEGLDCSGDDDKFF
jgi:hypothetical protein